MYLCRFLALNNPFRKACIAVVESPLFETAVLLLIVANTIVLALMDPTKVRGS